MAALLPCVLALWCGQQLDAQALPSGGHFAAGSGTIGGTTAILTINQSSASGLGVIDWNSFSIGSGHTVIFNNGSGATLNRVSGGAPSVIIGGLSASGSVYLINPQGVVVGPTGVIATGGRFVASTLDTTDAAFMQGGALTLSGTSSASVVNLGNISSSGGDVFLIARQEVVNKGTLSAPNGTAELVAGQQVLLQDSSSGQQVSVLIGSGGDVLNFGTVSAAQVNLQAADGNVYALAGNDGAIRATGTATRAGHIWLVAEQGKVMASGTLQASNADGTGGTVTMAANSLSVGDATVLAGSWSLATPVLTIDSPTAQSLIRSLDAGTSVAVQANGSGAQGNVTLASNLQWTGAASLTLDANHDVIISPQQVLSNTGSGNLTLRADGAAQDNGGSIANYGTVDWSASSGTVSAYYDMNGSYTAGIMRANPAWTAAPYSGLVSQISAYKLVNSLRDLQNVALDLAGNYALGVNLNDPLDPSQSYNPFVFTAIGSVATPFTGQFDGMGHTINQLDAPLSTPVPSIYGQMFGVIGPTGVVRNLGLTNLETFPENVPSVFGELAAVNHGTILNTYVTGYPGFGAQGNTVSGGLVGINDGLIERSWSDVQAALSNGPTAAEGRLVGVNNGTIVQSYTTINVPGIYGGSWEGLVGDNYGSVTQSYAVDQNFYSTVAIGGLVYNNESSGVIRQSFVTGPISGPGSAALAAINSGTIANDVYWDQQTTGQTQSVTSGIIEPAATNGLTTAQMSTPASFVGWDFGPSGAWVMPVNTTYPILRWQLAQ